MSFFTDPRAMRLPPIESPFAESLIAQSGLPDEMQELARGYVRDGYIVMDLGLPDFDAMADRIIRDLAPRYPEANRRVVEGWYDHEDVRAIACAPRMLELLGTLYQRRPIPFQTLNFDVGTEQGTHSDSLHFYSFPYRYMCGVWVALEDIDENNGPLHYYPGSHKLREFDMYDLGLPADYEQYPRYEEFIRSLAEAHGFERKEGLVKKGQAIIWSANLLHGGNAVKEPGRTRHSQVTHYFFEDCVYYLPMNTEPFAGKVEFREVINITSGEFVPHRYKDETIVEREQDTVWRYPRPLPDWIKIPKGVELVGDPARFDEEQYLRDVKAEKARQKKGKKEKKRRGKKVFR